MGTHFTRRIGDTGSALVLAPERHDPRRVVAGTSGPCVRDVADIFTGTVTARAFAPDARILVLDTSHAAEGVVLCRHGTVSPDRLGSAKRPVQAGDVIVSRLRPYLRQVAYVDDALFAVEGRANAVCVSTEFFVLRARPGFHAAAFVPFLLSAPVQAALAAGQEGGHHPRFSRELLASLRLPANLAANADVVGDRVVTRVRTIRAAFDDVAALARSLG